MRHHQRLGLLVITAMVSAASFGGTLYVDDSAVGANNGTSWADAYLYLQDALAFAVWDDTIFVAQGTYRPDESAYLDGLIDDDRRASFSLKMGVTLLGGFAGVGSDDPDARNAGLYVTILSGDLEGNDPAEMDLGLMLNAISREDNSIHVVVGTGTNNSAVLDGFTITGGNANIPGDEEWVSTEYGGGLYNGPGDCTVRDCVFVANSAQAGGGVYNRDGSRPVFVNCRFRRNVFSGMYNDTQSSPVLEGCVFEEHIRSGVANYDRSNPILTNCRFLRNGSENDFGGGISNGGGSCPVVNRCVFEDNFSGQRGGALYCADKSDAVVSDSVFRRNRGTWYGGAVFSELSRPVFRRCVFEDNESNSGGAISVGNWSWYEGAVNDVTIENCLFVANHVGQQGPVAGRGGAISAEIWQQNRLKVTNCTFVGNEAPTARAIFCDSFMHNSASEVLVSNCILWDGGNEVASHDKTAIGIQYSDIQGGFAGEGNLAVEPLFVKASAGDYHLQSGSPCVDKGDNAAVAEGSTDLDGHLRIRGKAVDMGAYELPIELGAIIYVDDNAPGTNKGTSWKNALWRLQDAIALAKPGQEIRVSEGTYRPAGPNGSRWASFHLKSGVAIKGGYDGYGAANPDARDVKAFKTILSGDLDGSMGELTKESFAGVMVPRYSSTTASYHVVMAYGVDATATLDGFTITGGVANGSDWDPILGITNFDGGGIYCVNASPTMVDCTIRGNCVVFTPGGPEPMGGGMYNFNGNPTLIRCVFELNAADDWDSDSKAGGLMNYYGEIRLTDCVFSDNRTFNSGGGIYNALGKVGLERCRFEGNHARGGGGAIFNERGELTLRNCLLAQNSSESTAGGIGSYGPCIVSNCTFVDNSNYAFVHSLFEDESSVISNSIFWNGGQEILAFDRDGLQVRYSDVEGGWPGQGNLDAEPLFADAADGDYRLKSQAGRWDANAKVWVQDAVTSPCIDAGDPFGPIGLEPFPNGGVMNLGFDGGTAEASKSWFGGDCAAVYAGDINGDCRVDLADLAILSQHWLRDGSGPR